MGSSISLLFLTGACLVPAAPAPDATKLKPNQVAASKPDKNGIVTMLRPVVTRLAEGDPVRVALHWALEKEPIKRDTVPGEVLWDDTVGSMTFHLTPPDGKTVALKLGKGEPRPATGQSLYYRPTFLFTLGKDDVSTDHGATWAWKDGKPDFTKPGLYRLKITGTIVRGKGNDPIPFKSESVALELGVRDLQPQAKVVEAARTALLAKHPKATTKDAFVTDDEAGQRLVRFRSFGMKWNYLDYTVAIKPDGTVAGISTRDTFTCVARGTKVDTEAGSRPIQELRVGDRVWGYDAATGKRVLTGVRLIRTGRASETLQFGDGLRVTPEHPLWAGEEWKSAGSVVPTDLLLDARLKHVPAGTPRRIAGEVEVFDLTVDAPHCFFAGGFLVHNKDRDYWPKVDDPWYDLWPAPEKK